MPGMKNQPALNRKGRVQQMAEEEKQRGFGTVATALTFGPGGGLLAGLAVGFVGPMAGLNPMVCALGAMGLGAGWGSAMVFKSPVFRGIVAVLPGTIGLLLAQATISGRVDMAMLLMTCVIPAAFVGLLAGCTKKSMPGIVVGGVCAAIGGALAYGAMLMAEKMFQLRTPMPTIVSTGFLFGTLVPLLTAFGLGFVKQNMETEPPEAEAPAP